MELNGYLTKPTTRLARYPLLLEVVLKYTPDDNPDKKDLPVVIQLVKDFLGKVNIESGRTENRFNLLQLDQQLVFRSGEQVVSGIPETYVFFLHLIEEMYDAGPSID